LPFARRDVTVRRQLVTVCRLQEVSPMPAVHLPAVLALLLVPAATAKWTFVTETDALRSSVETATVRREGVTVTYWTQRRFKKPQQLGGQVFDTSRHLNEGNCQTVSTRVLEVHFYRAEQPVDLSMRPAPEALRPDPGSVVAQELALACQGPQAI
jgi:hypothetical protein